MSLFAFIVLIIVLSSTVFSLRVTDLNFLSTTNYLTNEEAILNSAEFNVGESIFFVDRESYIQKIEVANPYIKVVGIEIVFPNKLIVHAVERNEVFAFKLADNTYAICDEELKVLEIRQTFVNTTGNAILVENSSLTIEVTNAILGTTINMPLAYSNIITSFATYMKEWDSNLANLRGNIETLVLNYEEENNLAIEMRQGVQIIINDAHLRLNDKVQMAFSVYDSDAIDRTKGILLILEQQNTEIIAMYDDGE